VYCLRSIGNNRIERHQEFTYISCDSRLSVVDGLSCSCVRCDSRLSVVDGLSCRRDATEVVQRNDLGQLASDKLTMDQLTWYLAQVCAELQINIVDK